MKKLNKNIIMNETQKGDEMEKYLSIKQITEQYSLSNVYVRRMISQGKIQTEKIEIGKNTFKHMVKESELNRWRNSVQNSGRNRADKRNKYTIYGTIQEIEKLQGILETERLETPLMRSNLKKIKIG